LINTASEESQFYVSTTNGKQASWNSFTKVAALRKLASIEISKSGSSLKHLAEEVGKLKSKNEVFSMIVISDGQQSFVDALAGVFPNEAENAQQLNVISVGSQWENNASVSNV